MTIHDIYVDPNAQIILNNFQFVKDTGGNFTGWYPNDNDVTIIKVKPKSCGNCEDNFITGFISGTLVGITLMGIGTLLGLAFFVSPKKLN